MSSYPRSQNLSTGTPGQYRVRGGHGEWWVEYCDNNGVWVAAEIGKNYVTKEEAEEAMDDFKSNAN